jgi:SRSO17 transposase
MTADLLLKTEISQPTTLADYCRVTLARIPRADQRRWGELYIRGLVSLPGRKSVRSISELIEDSRADQAIQQFVNQSPWDWRPIRGDLAAQTSSWLRPSAWVLSDFALPKTGNASVGVERQYAHSLGRVINCQAGLGLFLAGTGIGTPVDWRLRLPASWDADEEKRNRAHLPAYERHMARWEYLVSMLDELLSWGVEPAPVVLDSSHDVQTELLIDALERRGLRYLVRVGAGTRVAPGPGGSALTAGVAAADLWMGTHGRVLRAVGPGLGAAPGFALRQLPSGRPRQLLVQSSGHGRRSVGLWLTNLGRPPVPHLAELIRQVSWAGVEMERIRDRFGLGHFEGRSFRGWHHHATLVSLAHAFVTGQRIKTLTAVS